MNKYFSEIYIKGKNSDKNVNNIGKPNIDKELKILKLNLTIVGNYRYR